MGTYVNPGTRNMEIDIDDAFYVDKSMLIRVLNNKVNKKDRFICVSRPRRFGKTMAANMIAAYYSKGCDSHEIFSGLKISKDPTFEDNINRYTVIKLDINGAATGKGDKTIVQYYNENVVPELMKAYPNVGLSSDMSIAKALVSIHESTGDKFVFIIDEYDLPIRDGKYASELGEYIAFLVSLFKSEETNYTIALAYLTGIMPIIREKVQSKLNNFTEYTMLDADDMAPFMGFTEEEVHSLSQKSGMAFDDLKRWYDGYSLKGEKIYSPKSIIDAVKYHECDGYSTASTIDLGEYIFSPLRLYPSYHFFRSSKAIPDLEARLRTSSSVKPMKGAMSLELIMVYSLKLLSLDCTFSLMIGMIPVRYASAIAGETVLFLNRDTRKERYPLISEEYSWSRMITSYSSMMNTNWSPVEE